MFDITQSGVTNRRRPTIVSDEKAWEEQRNTQCNFDTIIQLLLLRSQPEDISNVSKDIVNLKDNKFFGFLFEDDTEINYWNFEFSIPHKSVFSDGHTDLGALYSDCEGVPMIKTLYSYSELPLFLDSTPELRNIYFEVISNE